MTYALPWCYSTAELKGPIHLTLSRRRDRDSKILFVSSGLLVCSINMELFRLSRYGVFCLCTCNKHVLNFSLKLFLKLKKLEKKVGVSKY